MGGRIYDEKHRLHHHTKTRRKSHGHKAQGHVFGNGGNVSEEISSIDNFPVKCSIFELTSSC